MKILSVLALALSANRVLCTVVPTSSTQQLLGDVKSSSLSLLDLHKALVEHSSITGSEHNVTLWLKDYLEKQDFVVELQNVAPHRENVFAYVGKSRKTKTLVSSHIDTVPPFWPYERRGDEIWGRGTVDAKGSVATQIKAVEALLASSDIKEGDVALLFVVGEETGGDGMIAANDLGLTWKTVIFGEPTELKLASGHKGHISMSVKAKGKAGHSGYPWLGRNANSMLIPALYALDQMTFPSSEKYGNTTVNIGLVEGGVAENVIAEDAFADIALRIAAGSPNTIKDMIRKEFGKINSELVLHFDEGYGPVDIDHDVKGFGDIVVNYGTDIPQLKGDHKRYLYGPGDILMAHSDHEHLKVSDLETAVEGYKTLILESLK